MTLEELKIIISAETAGLQSQLNQVQRQVSNMTKSVTKSSNSMQKALSSMFKGLSAAYITKQLFSLGKAAITAASDLEEVQNVVDVAFGSAASEINDFAKNAIYSLGLSETQAKKLASTYKAMANGMGIASDSGKEMALGLTSLAADMASFYNVSTDVANTALKSVFTDETESLKKFGVVITEANLEAYALSQGITESYKSMDQASKVALRYQYVLNATKNAQGDYARTSQSWANQIRLLTNQWEQLKVELGSIIQSVIKPLLIALNELLAKIVLVAKGVKEAFGIKTDTSSATVAAETADSYAEANDNAKALKKTISSFDELNTLNGNDSSATLDTGVSISATTSEVESLDKETNKYSSTIDKLANKISSLASVFAPIVETIKSALSDIWNNTFKPCLESIKSAISELKPLFVELTPYIQFVIDLISVLIQGIQAAAKGAWETIGEVIRNITIAISGLTDFIVGVFTGDWERAWNGIVKIFKGIINAIIAVIEGFINLLPNAINGIIKGINSIVGKIGSKIGINWTVPELTTKLTLPRLAKGGVIDNPTIAMMGEYAGARNNPEIVTPQSILKQTIDESNANLANVFSQMTRQIIASIENKDLEVILDGMTITKSVNNANNAYKRMTGQPLLV